MRVWSAPTKFARRVGIAMENLVGGATLSGSADDLSGGLEYAAGLRLDGSKDQISPEPVKLPGGQGAPRAPSIGDFRPGAALATAARSYTAIPASACVGGVWTPPDPAALSGVVYVPCAVNLAIAGRYTATIAAEGDITVSANSVTVGPGSTNPGAPALVGTSVVLQGADTTVLGQTVASASLEAHGARTALTCGAVADTIALSGADASARMEPWCLPAR